jgi:2-amino-4-hydroxy-6-hydroxymethyldihydropteridine diphosphokinase
MIFIALGSNLTGPWGTPEATVTRAIDELARRNIRVLNISQLLVTAPFGVINQPSFVNAVIAVATAMPPQSLMRVLHDIERSAGRKRLKRWGPRTLDLDLLDYHGRILRPLTRSIKPLVLPHPGIELRSFVLCPLMEIAPQWKHPVSHRTAEQSLRRLKPD